MCRGLLWACPVGSVTLFVVVYGCGPHDKPKCMHGVPGVFEASCGFLVLPFMLYISLLWFVGVVPNLSHNLAIFCCMYGGGLGACWHVWECERVLWFPRVTFDVVSL